MLEAPRSRLLAAGFAIAWVFAGINSGFWSQGVFFALAWLFAASTLIRSSRNVVRQFIDDIGFLGVRDDSAREALAKRCLAELRSNWFLAFSAPLVAGIITLTGLSETFPGGLTPILAGFTLGVVFLYAGKGFWGICVATLLLHRLTREKLELDPFYPDGKGGFTIPETFLHNVGWHFFSGGLLLPMAFEFGQHSTLPLAKLLVAVFMLLFFLAGILGIVYGKAVVVYAYEKARRHEMHRIATRMRELVESGAPAEAISNEAKKHASVEKMSHPQLDRYRVLAVLPQVVVAALPLATYGQTELLDFAGEIGRILAA